MEEVREEPQQEEEREDVKDRAFKWYDRYKQLKRLRDFIKKLRGKTKEEIKDTTEATEATEAEPQAEAAGEAPIEEPLGEGVEVAEPGIEATATEGEIGAEAIETAGESGIEGVSEAGAEIGAETTGAKLAGTEAGSIIETASATAGAEGLEAGVAGEAIGGAGLSAGAEAGAGLSAGAGIGAVGAGVGAAGVGTGAAVGGGAAAGAGAAGAGAAAGGAAAVTGGVVAAESNPVGWIITAVILIIIIFVVLIIILTGGGGGATPGSAIGPTPPAQQIATCPVANGSITTGSYQADPTNGHCSDNYGACDQDSRRAKSIDVSNSSQAVLPMIEGKSVKWTFVNKVDLKLEDCSNPGPTGCGKEFVFVNYLDGGKNWTLFIGHIGFTGMMMSQTYDSGTIVGSSATDHFHFSIGKDISDPTSFPSGGSDTRPGWLAADKDVGMCVPPPADGGGVCSVGTGYCSVFYLKDFFTDPTVANKMSIICNRESGGDPNGFNDSCLRPGGTLDYSGGLFQINLLAHTISDRQGNFLDCPTAFKSSTTGGLVARNSDLPCIIVDQTLADRCKTALLDPDANIKKAVELYNSSGFSPWAAAGACNVH